MARAYCNPVESMFSACCNCVEDPVDENGQAILPENMSWEDLLCSVFCKGIPVMRYETWEDAVSEFVKLFGRKPYILERREIEDLIRGASFHGEPNPPYAIVIIGEKAYVVRK